MQAPTSSLNPELCMSCNDTCTLLEAASVPTGIHRQNQTTSRLGARAALVGNYLLLEVDRLSEIFGIICCISEVQYFRHLHGLALMAHAVPISALLDRSKHSGRGINEPESILATSSLLWGDTGIIAKNAFQRACLKHVIKHADDLVCNCCRVYRGFGMESNLQGFLQPGLQALLLIEESVLQIIHGDSEPRPVLINTHSLHVSTSSSSTEIRKCWHGNGCFDGHLANRMSMQCST